MEFRDVVALSVVLTEAEPYVHEVLGGPASIGVFVDIGAATSVAVEVSYDGVNYVAATTAPTADAFVVIPTFVRFVRLTATGDDSAAQLGYVQ